MQFTLVIFNTYEFFIESFKSTKLAQTFFTFNISILFRFCFIKNGKISKKAPLIIHLCFKRVKHIFIIIFDTFILLVIQRYTHLLLAKLKLTKLKLTPKVQSL